MGIQSTLLGIMGTVNSINSTTQAEGWASGGTLDVLGMANECVTSAAELSAKLTALKSKMNAGTDSVLLTAVNSCITYC